MSLLHDFARVTRSRPCPICNRPDWCLVSRDDPPSSAICQRVESLRRCGDAGYLHVLRDQPAQRRPIRRVVTGKGPDLGQLAAEYGDAVETWRLGALSQQLGLSGASLLRLDIGWTGSAWSFPMQAPDGATRGIRLRTPSGRKFSVRGGREGVFMPRGLGQGRDLLLPEGPTDTAAALDLGFDAIGRPSCRCSPRLLAPWIKKLRAARVIVVADADSVGRAGGAELAARLRPLCADVRLAITPAKDLREWLRSGASRADVLAAIDAAKPIGLRIVATGGAR